MLKIFFFTMEWFMTLATDPTMASLSRVSQWVPQDAAIARSYMHSAATLDFSKEHWAIYRLVAPRVHALAVPVTLVLSSVGYIAQGVTEFGRQLKHLSPILATKWLVHGVVTAFQCVVLSVAATAWAVLGFLIGKNILSLAEPEETLTAMRFDLYKERFSRLSRIYAATGYLIDKVSSSPAAMRAIAALKDPVSARGPVSGVTSREARPGEVIGDRLQKRDDFLQEFLPIDDVIEDQLKIPAYQPSEDDAANQYDLLRDSLREVLHRLFDKRPEGNFFRDVLPFLGDVNDPNLAERLQVLVDEAVDHDQLLFLLKERPLSLCLLNALKDIRIPGSTLENPKAITIELAGSVFPGDEHDAHFAALGELMRGDKIKLVMPDGDGDRLAAVLHLSPAVKASKISHVLPAHIKHADEVAGARQVIDYKGNPISADGLKQLVQIIRDNKVVSLTLDLDQTGSPDSNVQQPPGYLTRILHALEANTSVSVLKLKGAGQVVANGHALMRGLLQNRTVRTLELPMGTTEENRELDLLDAVFHCRLSLMMNIAVTALLEQGATSSVILNLKNCPIGKDEVLVILELLAHDKLKELNLHGANFGTEDAVAKAMKKLLAEGVATALHGDRRVRNLQALAMGGLGLLKDQIYMLTRAAAGNPELKYVGLEGNDPGTNMVWVRDRMSAKRHISEAVHESWLFAAHHTETVDPKDISAVGLELAGKKPFPCQKSSEYIVTLLRADKVKTLVLDYLRSKIRDPAHPEINDGLQARKRVKEFSAALKTDVKKRPQNKNLEVVSMRHMNLDAATADIFMESVMQEAAGGVVAPATAIRELYLDGNKGLESWKGKWKEAYCHFFPSQAKLIAFTS